jgi:hypothetical protein
LGFFISLAEPDLHVLTKQIETVTGGTQKSFQLVALVSVGIAFMFALGLIRILYNLPLYKILFVLYGTILVLAIFTSREFLAIAFDASGATTGAMAVPFILAVASGISQIKKDSKASEKDSFGLVAIASTGAIMIVMLSSIIRQTDPFIASSNPISPDTSQLLSPFIVKLPAIATEALLALSPILIVFLLLQKISFHLSSKAFFRIIKGLIYALFGLILFLAGVYGGFIDAGKQIGVRMAESGYYFLIVIIGFMMGFFTLLTEPAVYILTHQIEKVTGGYIRRRIVLLVLATGVGIAVSLSLLRIIIPSIQLWHYLLPGYLLALGLMPLSPKLFVGIAFDSGGVASGPMTATFILAFSQGIARGIDRTQMIADGFGVIAMVALIPLIALQILGLLYKTKSAKKGIKP